MAEFDFDAHRRKKAAEMRAAQRAKLGPPKKTMFGAPPKPDSPWLGSVVDVVKELPRDLMPIIGHEDEINYAWRIYDATLAISLGNRELADEAFQRARIHYRKEKHALQAAVHEAGAVASAGEGPQQDDESKPA